MAKRLAGGAMPWWKAVSKQAICVRSGRIALMARTGARHRGWCSGASGVNASSFAVDIVRQLNRARIVRTAMDDAMTDGAQAMVAETILDEAEHVGEQMIAVRIRCFPPLLEQVFARGALHDEPRLRLMLVEQALAEQGRLDRRDVEQAELDARRSRVENEDRVRHGCRQSPASAGVLPPALFCQTQSLDFRHVLAVLADIARMLDQLVAELLLAPARPWSPSPGTRSITSIAR